MAFRQGKKNLDEDFDLQEEKFFDNEEGGQKDINDDDEVDPLDAYMQDMKAQAKIDQQTMGQKRKMPERVQEEDDPIEQYMDQMKKQLITEAKKNKKQGGKDGDNEDDDEFDFLDSDGEVDFDAVKKMKKKNFQLLDEVDHNKQTYKPFNKDFYIEHEDIKNMTDDQVFKIRNIYGLFVYRKDFQIRVKGVNVPKPCIAFAHLGFDEEIIDQIAKYGFTKPTEIQSQAIPAIMMGRDLVGIAKTGSGKTLAYIWPLLIHILDQPELEKNDGPIGIILCPTRELSQQVYVEAKKYARLYNISVGAILGGENKKDQWKQMKAGVEILIATPGRCLEMIKKKATNMRRCTYVVVDEADKMFSLGFEKQIRSLIGQVRPDRQTLLFTATFKKKIQNLVMDILTDPITINIGQDNQANEDVQQECLIFRNGTQKTHWLIQNLNQFLQIGKVIIFVNQIVQCNQLQAEIQQQLMIPILVLHGDKLQQERTQIINQFKQDKHLMIATDVASRGLDVPAIKTVINFENSRDSDTHIHRVGRTGRAGDKNGRAITLILDTDVKFAVTLMKNFELSGQVIQPELEMIAMKDEKFKMNRLQIKMGVNFAKGKDATKLLKQALSKGRNSSQKTGLGYKEPESESQDLKNQIRQEAQRVIASEKQDLQVIKYSDYLQQQSQKQQQQQQNETYGDQQTGLSGFQSQFSKPSNTFKRGFSDGPSQEIEEQPQSREDIRSEYQQKMKVQMQNQFRGTFKSAGTIEPDKSAPQIKYFKKADKK